MEISATYLPFQCGYKPVKHKVNVYKQKRLDKVW